MYLSGGVPGSDSGSPPQAVLPSAAQLPPPPCCPEGVSAGRVPVRDVPQESLWSPARPRARRSLCGVLTRRELWFKPAHLLLLLIMFNEPGRAGMFKIPKIKKMFLLDIKDVLNSFCNDQVTVATVITTVTSVTVGAAQQRSSPTISD